MKKGGESEKTLHIYHIYQIYYISLLWIIKKAVSD